VAGKKLTEALKKVDRLKLYQPQEAVELIKELAFAKFDETVEVHIRTGVDPRHADQVIRGSAALPAGTGKTRRVIAFAQGDKVR
jgi:large subunit ribosomal protein L1